MALLAYVATSLISEESLMFNGFDCNRRRAKKVQYLIYHIV